MIKYILSRLAQVPITLIGVVTLTFIILRVMPGDPAAAFLGDQASPESIAIMRAKFGLDKPLHVQYLDTLIGIFTGDLGRSFTTNRPVLSEIFSVFPETVTLAVAALLISSTLGVAIGMIAALKLNRLTDYVVMSFSIMGVSMPVFWFGLLLSLIFSYQLGLFPVAGMTVGPSWLEQLHGLCLPALTLSLFFLALTARITRSSMAEVLQADFIRTVRAKGAKEHLVNRHALRNAMIPIVTVVGLNAGLLFAGAVLTETVFARPGIGKLLVDAALVKDYPLVQAIVLLTGLIYIIVNLVVDILYAYLDPRVKYG